jgi:hypothetical protein
MAGDELGFPRRVPASAGHAAIFRSSASTREAAADTKAAFENAAKRLLAHEPLERLVRVNRAACPPRPDQTPADGTPPDSPSAP